MAKIDDLESLYYVWGDKPMQHLFKEEIPQFREDLALSNITESEYIDYAMSKEGRD